MIGERTNVTGSARFRRLIEAGDYQGAVDVALEQVRGGANILDVNMDADLLDGEQAMTTFLNLVATEPEVARIPIMVDSSRFSARGGAEVSRARGSSTRSASRRGRSCSSSRRGGSALRRRRGRNGVRRGRAGRHGRAQGRDLRPRHDLLVRDGWEPEDIVFDPNVLAVATGIEEHNGCEGVHRVAAADQGALPRLAHERRHLQPLVRLPRNDVVREAMHSAFLYDAIRAGLDMGIVNAGQLVVYEDISRICSSESRTSCTTAVRTQPTGSSASPSTVQGEATKRELDLSWREAPVGARLEHALVHGIVDFIETDTEEARAPPTDRST